MAINVVTAAMYARDKMAARRAGARRVRERTLWLLGLAGGLGGAWLVFFGLRHETRHHSAWPAGWEGRRCSGWRSSGG